MSAMAILRQLAFPMVFWVCRDWSIMSDALDAGAQEWGAVHGSSGFQYAKSTVVRRRR
jgi:hypothetical protein